MLLCGRLYILGDYYGYEFVNLTGNCSDSSSLVLGKIAYRYER
ncbi:hypothetical protein [Moraxella lacunata]